MATVRWISGATPVTQRTRFTLGGTWLATETATLTINGNDLTVTLADQVTPADVTDILARAVNAASKTDNLRLNESRNIGGQEIPEFREVKAWVGGAEFDALTLVIEAKTTGKPFTITASETSAAGTISAGTDDPAATGPNHFSNADNWSGGAVPSTDDVVLFDGGSQSCLYDLSAYTGGTEIEPDEVRVHQSFTGHIGLARMNMDDPNHPYAEYRQQYLLLKTDGGGGVVVTVGTGTGAGSGRIKIDTGAATPYGIFYASGARTEAGVPATLIKSSSAAGDYYVYGGDVGIGYFDDETVDIDNLYVGGISGAEPRLYVGKGGTITTGGVKSGQVELKCGGTTLTVQAGTVVVRDHVTGDWGTINVYGGQLKYESRMNITTKLKVGKGATADLSRALQGVTIAAVEVSAGATLRGPADLVTYTSGVDLVQCSLPEVNLDIGSHRTVTPSAI